MYVCVLVTQLCPSLCDPMDWSLPGSSVHGLLQARILEWVAISFSRGSINTKFLIYPSHPFPSVSLFLFCTIDMFIYIIF